MSNFEYDVIYRITELDQLRELVLGNLAYYDDNQEQRYLTSEFVYRGQAWAHHCLTSTLQRSGKTQDMAQQQAHLKQFWHAIRGHVRMSERDLTSDLERWAVGQHYGLPTPFLDWSEALFVAAYFAFSENRQIDIRIKKSLSKTIGVAEQQIHQHWGSFPGDEQPDYAVWALNETRIEKRFRDDLESSINKSSQLKKDIEGLPLFPRNASMWRPSETTPLAESVIAIADEIIPADPCIRDRCRHAILETESTTARIIRSRSWENPRLVSQRGIFTLVPLGKKPLDQWVSDAFGTERSDVLVKFSIASKLRKDLMKLFDAMNITPLSLFPDIHGSAQYCKSHLPDRKNGPTWHWFRPFT